MEIAGLVRPAFLCENTAVHDEAETRVRLEGACYWAAIAGLAPTPEQRFCLEHIVAVDEDYRSVYRDSMIIACRQNLKTGVMKQAAAFWVMSDEDELIVWSAHRLDAVNEAVEDLDNMFSAHHELSRKLRYFHRAGAGVGDAELATRNGVRMVFKVRSKGGGRALAAERVILDEYWAVQAAHLGALVPIMAAKSVTGDPQMLGGSSAARPESTELRAEVKRGRAAKSPALFYAEWCSPPAEIACDRGSACDHDRKTPGCGCDKPEMIRLGNPSLDTLISLEYIQTVEREKLPPAEFGRERMGWHDAGEEDEEVIPLVAWANMLDQYSAAVSRPALSVVFSGDRSHAAVGLAGWRSDGLVHVEVAKYLAGTAWTADYVADRYESLDPVAVAVDGGGHERTIIPALEEAGVKVTKMNAGDVASAFGMFFDAVQDTRMIRHRGQDDLTLALAGATTRPIGDAGTAWGRRKSGVDICPLVAATEAVWAFLTNAPALEESDDPGVYVIGEGEPPDETGLPPALAAYFAANREA